MLHDYFPLCVFIDPSVPNGNEIVKGLQDMAAAKCEVNLLIEPYYIQNSYPNDLEQLKAVMRHKCNAIEGYREMGANRGAAVLLTNNASLPRQMCGASAPDIYGCAELSYDPGEGQKARMRGTGTYGGIAEKDQVAISIIGPGGFSADKVAAKVQGQGQMSLPQGVGGGNGIGSASEGYAAPAVASSPGWTPEGCAEMKKNSFYSKNPLGWNRNEKNYVYQGDASKYMNLMDGRQLFGSSAGGGAGATSGSPSSGGAGGDSGDTIDRQVATVGSGNPGGSGHPFGGAGSPFGDSAPVPAAPPERKTVNEISSVYAAGDSNSTNSMVTTKRGVDDSGSMDTSTITFDDSMKKSAGGGNGGSGSTGDGVGLKIRKASALDPDLDPDFFNGKKKGDAGDKRVPGSALRQSGSTATIPDYQCASGSG